VRSGYSCFPSIPSYADPGSVYDPKIFEEGSSVSMKIVLFERYPEAYHSNSHRIDYYVPDSVISILDPASGLNSPNSYNYNTTLISDPYSPSNQTGTPVALTYVMHISNPSPVVPYEFQLQVTATRYGPDGSSVTSMVWYIPVTGVISNEVPNFIPVASDPTLIFFVLRDPPGGASFATLSAGTSIDFSMSIENMYSYDGSFGFDWSLSGGVSGSTKAYAGLLGVGIVTPTFGVHATVGGGQSKQQSVSTSRDTSTSYEYSITFDYEFSTSSDPFTAGHASDIIVGGGVDLVVSQAIQGFIIFTT
jgi:hypothetical protein